MSPPFSTSLSGWALSGPGEMIPSRFLRLPDDMP
jgi:hypothetical protein